MKKELLIGAGAGVIVLLAIWGVDVTPVLLIGLIAGLVWFVFESRGAGRRFEVVTAVAGPGVTDPVTFDDIGGQDMPKRELREALEFVKEADQVTALGIRPLRGILLAGPPGTGKTLMAKAAAHYAESIFLSTSGSQFVEMYAGVGAQRVRQLFADARERAKKHDKRNAMIFIDELEVLGGRRGQHGSHMEYDQTLNQLLVEMDGLSTAQDGVHVLVIGATNRMDLLDPALMRPGRFDRVVQVPLPDRAGRLHILRIHAQGKPLAADVDLQTVAKDTFGFSGAHLESLLNEAAILAMRRGEKVIDQNAVSEAIDKVMMGEKLDRKPRREELRRVAYHEVGHALIAESVRPGAVATITVTPRGQALGYMRQTSVDDQYLYTKEELYGQIAVLLGGALAEEVIFGSRSTGSAGDFDHVVRLAERIVYAGMSGLGIVHKDKLGPHVLHEEIQKIIDEIKTHVRERLTHHVPILHELAAKLMEDERVAGDELRELLSQAEETTSLSQAASTVAGTDEATA